MSVFNREAQQFFQAAKQQRRDRLSKTQINGMARAATMTTRVRSVLATVQMSSATESISATTVNT